MNAIEDFEKYLYEGIKGGLDRYVMMYQGMSTIELKWPVDEEEETAYENIVSEYGRVPILDLDYLNNGNLDDLLSEMFLQLKGYRANFGMLKNLSKSQGKYSGVFYIVPYCFDLKEESMIDPRNLKEKAFMTPINIKEPVSIEQ